MTRSVAKLASLTAAVACVVGLAAPAQAQEVKIVLGMSGWTGFAPLTLADKAGIFKKNGLDVDIKMIPQKDRHLALASKSIQCAATTVETHVAWNANGVPIVQIFQMDKSFGADGMAVRGNINSFADLKGKTIGVDAPGTAPYFGLAWMLSKNGMSLKDVKTTTLSPQAAAQALTNSYFQALEMIKADPAKSNEIMGAAVKQTGEQFAKSSSFLRWQDKAANQKFFAGELQAFMKDATAILLEAGIIRKAPDDLNVTFDASFIK